MNYKEFLKQKTQLSGNFGFDPIFMPDFLFDFQKYLVNWVLTKGRSAIFADCGLGKSPMELVWAENVYRKTNKPVLLLTPLAVSIQMVQEAKKFGIDAKRSKGEIESHVVISNYEKLHLFSPNDFGGVILDESSILKNFKGEFKKQITIFMRKVEYRLLATATPSPNDFIELGTSSESLGYLGYMDMLGKFFKNDMNSCDTGRGSRFGQNKWRLKGHAEEQFWRWVCSWSRAVRKPSDIGFSDDNYNLKPLIVNDHEIFVNNREIHGTLFNMPAVGLKEQRDETRSTIKERCEKATKIANSSDDFIVIWCNLNAEGDLLEKLIPDAIQVSGKDKDDKKEEKLVNFSLGKNRVMIIKPKIGAFGLNWQHCNHIIYFPTYSFEQYYQAIRRCWRFGQKREVKVDLIFTDGDKNMINSMKNKQDKSDIMFTNLVKNMNNVLNIKKENNFNKKEELPAWL